jgi:hypothetical protein
MKYNAIIHMRFMRLVIRYIAMKTYGLGHLDSYWKRLWQDCTDFIGDTAGWEPKRGK